MTIIPSTGHDADNLPESLIALVRVLARQAAQEVREQSYPKEDHEDVDQAENH